MRKLKLEKFLMMQLPVEHLICGIVQIVQVEHLVKFM